MVEDINLPIQSGDDEMLKRMRRGYTYGFYRDLVGRMRERIPNLSMATDIIVGFPGETEAQFQNTLKAMAEIKWDVVHIAAYSTRTGTPAAEYEDQLPLEEKKRRVHEVERLQKEIATARNAPLLGQDVEVLIEGQSKASGTGRTRSNKLVHIASEEALAGQLVEAHGDPHEPVVAPGRSAADHPDAAAAGPRRPMARRTRSSRARRCRTCSGSWLTLPMVSGSTSPTHCAILPLLAGGFGGEASPPGGITRRRRASSTRPSSRPPTAARRRSSAALHGCPASRSNGG